MNEKICPICNSPIPANAPGGLCPACVLRDAEEPPPSPRTAPSVEEVAAAFPKLEIIELIGQGGMGFVYKVRQPHLDRIVALKILSPELSRDPGFEERFAREARTLAKLHHPNIVTIFDYGETGRGGVPAAQAEESGGEDAAVPGFFYLLMEYVDGVNLRQAMRAGRFTPEQALAVVPGICDALQAAHAQNIWHRDIKPENILLDARGGVKIADFGIARIVGDPQRDFTLTATGGWLGSAAYMAPEQHEKPHDVDHRADIYSLGVVIYEMLTGELPLGRFPLPSQRAEVNARIDDIVLKTLEKERELRQQSATEVKTEVAGATAVGGPARKIAGANGRSALTRMPLLVRWSLGLLAGGGALMGAAAVVREEFASPQTNSMMALLIAIGGAAAAAGVLGSLWALYEMKRGWIPSIGRWLLIALTIAPLSAAAIGFMWVGWHDPGLVWERAGKGALPVMMGWTYGVLALGLGILFLLARPLSPTTSRRRMLGKISITLAAIATLGCVVLTKRYDYHWPNAFYRQEASLNLLPANRPSDDQLLARLKKAAGPFADDYELSVRNGLASVASVTRELPPRYEGTPFRITHPFNCLARLRDLLPPDAVKSSYLHESVLTTRQMRAHDPRLRPERDALAILAALGALLAALAGGRRAVFVVAGGVALHGVMFLLPVWPADENATRVLDAPPLPPKLAAEEMPAPDFRTPEAAVTSVYDARYFGRLDAVKQGVSKALAAEIEAHPNGWEGFMSRNRNKRFVVQSSERKESHDEEEVVEATVTGAFIHPQPLSGRNWLTDSANRRSAVFEDGEWKLDSLDSASDQAREPRVSAVETLEKMNALANDQKADAFMEFVGPFLRKAYDPLPAPVFFMEPFYGRIRLSERLPQQDNESKWTARVIACIERNGGITYTTFTYTNHGGKWLLSHWDKPFYRARCRIYFNPPNADGKSILRAHLGDTKFGYVEQHRGTQFDLQGDDDDPDVAARKANKAAAKLEASLKKAGLDVSFRVLEPAVPPEKPWKGDGTDGIWPEIKVSSTPKTEDSTAEEEATKPSNSGAAALPTEEPAPESEETWTYELSHATPAEIAVALEQFLPDEWKSVATAVPPRAENNVLTLTGSPEWVRLLAMLVRAADLWVGNLPLDGKTLYSPEYFIRGALPALACGKGLDSKGFDAAFLSSLKQQGVTSPQLARALASHVFELEKMTRKNTGTPFEVIMKNKGASTTEEVTIPCADQPDQPLVIELRRTVFKEGYGNSIIAGLSRWLIEEAKRQSSEPLTVPKVKSAGPQLTPAVPVEEVFRTMHAAANASNGEEFAEHETADGGIRINGQRPPVINRMEPFFGELLSLEHYESKPGSGGLMGPLTTDLIAELKRADGTTEFKKFGFYSNGEEWKFDGLGLPASFRAGVLMEFLPPEGEPESIIRTHMRRSYDSMWVPGERARFFILGTDSKPEKAVEKANENVERLRKSLERVGMDRYLKIIQPAKTPERPPLRWNELPPSK